MLLPHLPALFGERGEGALREVLTRDGEGWTRLRLEFRSLSEARKRLLALGGAVELLEPTALRNSVADLLCKPRSGTGSGFILPRCRSLASRLLHFAVDRRKGRARSGDIAQELQAGPTLRPAPGHEYSPTGFQARARLHYLTVARICVISPEGSHSTSDRSATKLL